MPKTTRKAPSRRFKKTRRARRRQVGRGKLEEIIASVEMRPNLTVNPKSKFVVATYWWGRGNMNRNLQKPCPEDIMDEVKEILEEELLEDDAEFKAEIYDPFHAMWTIRRDKRAKGEDLTPEEQDKWKAVSKTRMDALNAYFAKPEVKARMPQLSTAQAEKYRKSGKFREPTTYDLMIAKWEDVCKEMGCNYLAVEYPQFAVPGGYQLAINAKPLFIRKALEACQGRGVLYIDGDMFIKKYPALFDMPNIDFGARNWNVDPRSSAKFKEDVCFDPYIFETSGGTMFFGDTPMSRQLLDAWVTESALPKSAGKADDRILSQVYTVGKFAPKLNTLHLPIEYLWLTDLYAEFDFQGAADVSNIFIEHPYCLTGEERAAEMSAATTNRQPIGYSEQIEEQVECETRGGTFYEYIYFPTREAVDAYGPYLKYMKTSKNPSTEEALFEVVDFDDKYGRYSALALKNLADAKALQVASIPGATVTDTELKLPLLPSVVQVLAGLLSGRDVFVGGEARPPAYIEIAARNIGPQQDAYLVQLKVDHSSSMFFSAKNPIVVHLLAMCKTLEDMNIHLKESFLFLSRIRWALRTAQSEASRLKGRTSLEIF